MTPYRTGLQGKPFVGSKRSAAYTAWKAGRDDAAKTRGNTADLISLLIDLIDDHGMLISQSTADTIAFSDGECFYALKVKATPM